jgi:hypothetical protein
LAALLAIESHGVLMVAVSLKSNIYCVAICPRTATGGVTGTNATLRDDFSDA